MLNVVAAPNCLRLALSIKKICSEKKWESWRKVAYSNFTLFISLYKRSYYKYPLIGGLFHYEIRIPTTKQDFIATGMSLRHGSGQRSPIQMIQTNILTGDQFTLVICCEGTISYYPVKIGIRASHWFNSPYEPISISWFMSRVQRCRNASSRAACYGRKTSLPDIGWYKYMAPAADKITRTFRRRNLVPELRCKTQGILLGEKIVKPRSQKGMMISNWRHVLMAKV